MNKKIIWQTILLFILGVFVTGISAQRLPDEDFSPNLHGIQFSVSGNQTAYPIIKLGAQNVLQLNFDDFDTDIKSYYYTFELCDANWNNLELTPFYYIKGFTQARITDYHVSSYAKQKYIHYQASFPQQNCMPIKSGNYLLKVFLDGDTSQLVFTRRFLVVDSKVAVSAQIQQPFDNRISLTHQKVQFSINVSRLQISNPLEQLKVVVLQNFRWDNAIRNLQPSFMRGSDYEYNGERDVVFQAGKEYRWVDLRSFRFQSDRIQNIDVMQTPFSVNLMTDLSRVNKQYLPYKDYDGAFSIASSEQINPNWQGDYANVHFSFRPEGGKAYVDKDVYIIGAMNNYLINDADKLHYDASKGLYETTQLLKQGYYDYFYATKETNKPSAPTDLSFTEGNYWETENNYTILVYYQAFSDRAPQLVSCTTVNSRL